MITGKVIGAPNASSAPGGTLKDAVFPLSLRAIFLTRSSYIISILQVLKICGEVRSAEGKAYIRLQAIIPFKNRMPSQVHKSVKNVFSS